MATAMMSHQLLWRGSDHAQVAPLVRIVWDDQHAEIIPSSDSSLRGSTPTRAAGWAGGLCSRSDPGWTWARA